MFMREFLLIQFVHDFLGTKTETYFLGLGVDVEDAVLEFIAPEEFVSFKVLDAVIVGYELPHSGLADIL